MCEGKTPKEAAFEAGIPWQNVYRQQASANRALELAGLALGVDITKHPL